jgi:plasmid stabilization system protein ParE
MARRKIDWTRTAFLQKDMIIRYWNDNNQSVEYSIKLSRLIDERLLLVASFPEIGKSSTFSTTRVIFIENFSVFYKYNEHQILVTTIWDNRQNPSTLFKKLEE